MRIIAVDDEQPSLKLICGLLGEVDPDCTLDSFSKPREALDHAEANPVDVAFLDINMRGMSGVELARRIKVVRPEVNIVFTTGYSEFMGDAFEIHASGYLMKPITAEKLRAELVDLRNPVKEGPKHRLTVRCFGNFEVFVDGVPMKFKYAKSKEAFAYMVDRFGAMVTLGEMNAVLWESGNHHSYLRDLRKDILDRMKEAGCSHMLSIEKGKMAVDFEDGVCDYYDWRRGRVSGINAYRGEYMSQYSWGEFTKGYLE